MPISRRANNFTSHRSSCGKCHNHENLYSRATARDFKADVRVGSTADLSLLKNLVRFTPRSGHRSGEPRLPKVARSGLFCPRCPLPLLQSMRRLPLELDLAQIDHLLLTFTGGLLQVASLKNYWSRFQPLFFLVLIPLFSIYLIFFTKNCLECTTAWITNLHQNKNQWQV